MVNSIIIISWLFVAANAFVLPSSLTKTNAVEASSTASSLHAFVPPTMIIGPMIRKMQEEKARKNQPLTSDEEKDAEAPGLRIGRSAWKWPPVWPYDETFFLAMEDFNAQKQPDLMGMASMLGGTPQMPTAAAQPDEKEKFDPVAYWTEANAEEPTEMDPDAVEKLRSHFGFYIRDGMSVLELGAAENSYLPEGLKLSRHVGVGLTPKLMEKNPSLTERLVVNLNKVVPEQDVDSDELRQLASEPFDVIIMTNTADFLTHPREVYRTCWHLLKPGGLMINAFSGKDALGEKFTDARTRAWAAYNDDQHMWISGSYFAFSAGDGWQNLVGFDISPETAKKADDSPLSMLQGKKSNNLYVVQATRNVPEESIDESNPEKSFRSQMWMLPTMESRDKELVAPRIRRAYELARTMEERDALKRNVECLPPIYESLIKMDQFSFTFAMQAQLAVDLISDPDFVANDEQIAAMKQGLGLRTPSKNFWAPVGQNTAAMTAEDKINLLSHIVPRFGSGDPKQEAALDAFVTGMKPTFEVIRSTCPEMVEADVQLLGTELLAAEVLKPGRSTRQEFAEWLGALTASEMETLLENRKSYKKAAETELSEFKAARDAEKARKESEEMLMKEQVQKAREERTMIFNPRSNRFEEVKKGFKLF